MIAKKLSPLIASLHMKIHFLIMRFGKQSKAKYVIQYQQRANEPWRRKDITIDFPVLLLLLFLTHQHQHYMVLYMNIS